MEIQVNPTSHPFKRDFWLGTVDARPAALLRMALALVLAFDLGDRLRDFHAFYSSAGITNPPGSLLGFPSPSLLFLSNDARFALGVFLLGFAVAAALAVGWHTRIVSVLAWVLVTSVHNRNPFIGDGGDNVLRLMLFWGMWSSWGACWSLDARRSPAPCRRIFALPVRLMQFQVAYIYLASALWKHGETWLDGSAIHRVLSAGGFARGLGPALSGHPILCKYLTFATLAVEYALPVMLFIPWRRGVVQAIAIACGVALHVGIFATMRIGVFSYVMPASFLLFVHPGWLDALARKGQTAPPPSPSSVPTKLPRLTTASLGFVVVLVCLKAGFAAAGIHSRWLSTPLALLGQSQHWPMFAPDVPRKEYQLIITGTRTDGTTIDIVANLLPELGAPREFRYTRWRKLREIIVMGNARLRAAFGRYVCRRALGGAIPNLRAFDLFVHMVPIDPPGPPHTALSMHQDCLR